MGLELVQLVLELKDEFGTSFPDDRYWQARTVGEMCLVVIDDLRVHRGEVLDRAETFERLRAVVCDVMGLDPDEVTWESDFVRDLGAG